MIDREKLEELATLSEEKLPKYRFVILIDTPEGQACDVIFINHPHVDSAMGSIIQHSTQLAINSSITTELLDTTQQPTSPEIYVKEDS